MPSLFTEHRAAIAALPRRELRRDDVLDGRFALASGEGFEVHYAPFDHVNAEARIVLVGLTPGWQQTRLAFEAARDCLDASESEVGPADGQAAGELRGHAQAPDVLPVVHLR